MRTATLSRFVGAVQFAALMIILCSCKPHDVAPSPSNSGALSESELSGYKISSEQGNSDAMYRLAIYYLFYEQDDEQGWSWMEKSAEAGNSEAREAVLDHYATMESPEKQALGEKLKKKWGTGASTHGESP